MDVGHCTHSVTNARAPCIDRLCISIEVRLMRITRHPDRHCIRVRFVRRKRNLEPEPKPFGEENRILYRIICLMTRADKINFHVHFDLELRLFAAVAFPIRFCLRADLSIKLTDSHAVSTPSILSFVLVSNSNFAKFINYIRSSMCSNHQRRPA